MGRRTVKPVSYEETDSSSSYSEFSNSSYSLMNEITKEELDLQLAKSEKIKAEATTERGKELEKLTEMFK